MAYSKPLHPHFPRKSKVTRLVTAFVATHHMQTTINSQLYPELPLFFPCPQGLFSKQNCPLKYQVDRVIPLPDALPQWLLVALHGKSKSLHGPLRPYTRSPISSLTCAPLITLLLTLLQPHQLGCNSWILQPHSCLMTPPPDTHGAHSTASASPPSLSWPA